VPNLTNNLEPIDLSTAAKIIAKMDLADAGDSRTAFIGSMITEVSTAVCDYLGLHTLRAERTERYELRKFSKALSLDAVNVSTSGLVVKRSAFPSQLSSAIALTIDEDFILHPRTGTITLLNDQSSDPLFVEVTYTGGFFETTGDLGSDHGWLTDAAEMQILYRLQRQDALGGNVDTTGGQGTNFSPGTYGFLPMVKAALQRHRRVIV
jgi:hypothetical protein